MNKPLPWLTRARNIITKICAFQAAAFIMSLPFLIGHGLAMSHISLIGNVLLNPIIMIFMMISSIIFFSELLGFLFISYYAIQLLEFLCKLWHKVLLCTNCDILFHLSFAQGLLVIFTALLCFTFCVYKNTGWLSGLLYSYLLLVLLLSNPVRVLIEDLLHNNTQKCLVLSRGPIWVSRDHKGRITVHSEKQFKKYNRRSGFLDFEFKPMLAKSFGKVIFSLPSDKFNYKSSR